MKKLLHATNKNIVVACLYPIFPQRIGGMDRFFWAFDKKVKESENIITWLFPVTEDDSHYKENGLSCVFFPVEGFGRKIIQFLKQQKVDILFTHFIGYNTIYPLLWKKAGVKKLIVVDHMSRPRMERPKFYRYKYFLKGLATWGFIDRIIAVSSFVKLSIKHEIGSWWNNKIQVIYSGVDTAIFTAVNRQHTNPFPKLFTIGHLIEDKGIQCLIDALLIVIKRGLYCHLDIAGNGPYKEKLEKQVMELRLDHYVTFLGNITNQQEMLQQADLVIIPSLWKEAAGFTVIEALILGSVIIASNIGGIKEIAHPDAAILFEPGNELQLSNKIIDMLTHPEKRDIIQCNALKIARERYNLNEMVNNYYKLI